jgi:hypothetical protein
MIQRSRSSSDPASSADRQTVGGSSSPPGQHAPDDLATFMALQAQYKSATRNAGMGFAGAFMGVAFLLLSCLVAYNSHWRSNLMLIVGIGAAFGLGLVAVGILNESRNHEHIRKQLYELLSRTNDTRLIGHLIALSPNQLISRNREQALIRLLPQMRPEDAQHLSRSQWQYLYYHLQGKNPQMVQAVLEAIAHCGGIAALPYVQPLADGKRLAGRDARIQLLANSCAQQLQSRVDRLNTPQVLLRPSASPSSEILLRPAMGSSSKAPQQLLRAVDEQYPDDTLAQADKDIGSSQNSR